MLLQCRMAIDYLVRNLANISGITNACHKSGFNEKMAERIYKTYYIDQRIAFSNI